MARDVLTCGAEGAGYRSVGISFALSGTMSSCADGSSRPCSCCCLHPRPRTVSRRAPCDVPTARFRWTRTPARGAPRPSATATPRAHASSRPARTRSTMRSVHRAACASSAARSPIRADGRPTGAPPWSSRRWSSAPATRAASAGGARCETAQRCVAARESPRATVPTTGTCHAGARMTRSPMLAWLAPLLLVVRRSRRSVARRRLAPNRSVP
jgi:hypothetical protein